MSFRSLTLACGLALAFAGVDTATAASGLRNGMGSQSPHGVFMAVGEYQADLIYCGLAKPDEAGAMKADAYQTLAARGLYMADFDRDYEIGFQKAIIHQRSMSESGRVNYCKSVGRKAKRRGV